MMLKKYHVSTEFPGETYFDGRKMAVKERKGAVDQPILTWSLSFTTK